jgi:hypothetical protein
MSVRWLYFAGSVRAERVRRYPGCEPLKTTVCPMHGTTPGAFTNLCMACHREAWDWTAERFLAAPVVRKRRKQKHRQEERLPL